MKEKAIKSEFKKAIIGKRELLKVIAEIYHDCWNRSWDEGSLIALQQCCVDHDMPEELADVLFGGLVDQDILASWVIKHGFPEEPVSG